ncbi:translationally-controlled tumor protein homolog [Osmerus eperlanus]|uniref:Translationally-controlled tumor protein homolog n=1 Tax=Osmerus mordax TaxID=8014 RepID=C1BJI6_OSMMO|nr:Translationally-controlled tumor protein [Osmerus mordax]ACO10068.1 Translationally-controlled tumor protein [Osmerus mordax]
MIIYKCIITGDEMFSDSLKVKETPDGMMYEVTGKLTSRTDNIDDSLIGGNASAEGGDEGCAGSTVSGVDIVLNSNLQETTPYDKKAYSGYIKKYLKDVKAKLEETNPDRVKDFMAKAPACVKMILENIDKYQFFMGEGQNPDGMIGLLDYREDGVTPYMLFFKDGLEAEKV